MTDSADTPASFVGGYPTAEAAQALYDELDYQLPCRRTSGPHRW
jgi:hypothetical protein